MLLPISWLKDMINLSDISDSLVEEKLFACGFEIEEKIKFLSDIQGVVVGKILSIESHPNADRLKICNLDCGKYGHNVQIVTGAANIRINDFVPVALENSTVYDNNNKTILIKKI